MDELLASIREAELELVKWQNVDCQYNGLYETEKIAERSDQNEDLIRYPNLMTIVDMIDNIFM